MAKSRNKKKRKEPEVRDGVGFITPQQAGAEIGVTPKTILDWIDAGKLEAKQFGPRTIRISLDQWERFKADRPARGPAGRGAPAA